MNKKKFLTITLVLYLIFLSGYTKITLHQGLTQNEANEILVALHDRGIDAEKNKEEKHEPNN